MPYKFTGDYVRRKQGDYMRGDPFLGAALMIGRKLVPGIAKRAFGAVKRFIKRPTTAQARAAVGVGAGAAGTEMYARARARRAVEQREREFDPGMPPQFRRKMNPYNPAALRRATRRLERFRAGATKALRELGYRVQRGGRR